MSTRNKVILKLLCILLLLHHSFGETDAISRYKPQQPPAQAVQTQQNSQPKQQMQQRAKMQQGASMQQEASMQQDASMQQQTHPHQDAPMKQQTFIQQLSQSFQPDSQLQPQKSQQNSVETSSSVDEKEPTREITLKDTNYEPDAIDPLKLMNEIKRENPLHQSLHPSTPPLHPYSPYPAHSGFPMPPMWSPHHSPFSSQSFLSHQAYAPQSFPTPTNYGMPPFATPSFPTNPYQYNKPPNFGAPKFLPFMGFPQPWFMPYQQFPQPEPWYPAFFPAINDFEDTASRSANGHRPLFNGRDSPIYYLPTPFSTFLPNFGYQTNQHHFSGIPTYPGFGQTYNLPVNFLANGKPTGIHSFMPNFPVNTPYPAFNAFNPRPFTPSFPVNYFHPSYASQPPTPPISPPPSPFHDSKLTSLKQPFYFNGRPDGIYVLQNSLNPLYSGL